MAESAAGARGSRAQRLELDLAASGVDDNARLANLCGPLDANLAQIGAAFGVHIGHRGARFLIEGPAAASRQAAEALQHFHQLAGKGLAVEDIQLGLVELRSSSAQRGGSESASDDSPILHTRKTDLQGRTPRQREYLRNILSHDVSFGIGPAGTGKTYLAVACAVDALERDAVKRIVLTRPAVEAGEQIGRAHV